MSKQGLAEATKVTTPAPTMYQELEQNENVARGCVEVIEVILYDATKTPQRYLSERHGVAGAIKRDESGSILYEEAGRDPYFCQDPLDVYTLEENNPKSRVETFTIQLRKPTAIEYINSKRNMDAFKRGA